MLSRSAFWGNNHLEPFKCKILIKVFQYKLKLVETFLIEKYFFSNAKKKKKKKRKKNGTNFDLTTDSSH